MRKRKRLISTSVCWLFACCVMEMAPMHPMLSDEIRAWYFVAGVTHCDNSSIAYGLDKAVSSGYALVQVSDGNLRSALQDQERARKSSPSATVGRAMQVSLQEHDCAVGRRGKSDHLRRIWISVQMRSCRAVGKGDHMYLNMLLVSCYCRRVRGDR